MKLLTILGMSSSLDLETIGWNIKNHDIDYIRLETEDINGVSRGFNVHSGHFMRSVVKNGHGLPQGVYSFETNKCALIPDTGTHIPFSFSPTEASSIKINLLPKIKH